MTFLTKNQFNFIQNDLVSLTISDFLSSNDPKSVILKFFWFNSSFERMASMSNSSKQSHNWSIRLSFLIGWRDLNHKVRRGLEMDWTKSYLACTWITWLSSQISELDQKLDTRVCHIRTWNPEVGGPKSKRDRTGRSKDIKLDGHKRWNWTVQSYKTPKLG